MTIAEVKTFINSFIKDEHICNKANYNFSISDDEYEKMRLKVKIYFHTVNNQEYWRGLEEDEVKELDVEMKDLYSQNVDKAVPRTLFQIKQYKNPKVGEGLAQWLVNDELFACYTSYTEETGRELGYNKLFYIANTDEGLKIIYDLTYGIKEPEWRHSHDLKINQVKNPGNLIVVEKYVAPEETNSLADYKK
jgi:hypothetical protein